MRPTRLLLLVAAGALVLSAGVPVEPAKNTFAGDDWKLPPEKPDLKPAAGREQVLGNCLLCHSADYVATQPPLLRTQWTATVEKMRGKFGAPIPTNKVPAIVDYLTANYGRENPPK
ncbi:MAG TPA: cytochrome c [Candidatus Limnocylindria bacterium]|jgi:mono/diheme cytochrome c family protein|nr:cytochrome c [Candidatus Limnocylindria bacterium]